MYTMKGGWVGQTFALARGNESEGRKSRIRRSKEERKAMVESFIKKYQKSNNGNFPSLNLTHKEVGGSFYTVREIVRDIIQENRVLGPAKLSPEELSSDQLLEQHPLFSISIEPQTHLVSNYSQGTGEEFVLGSDGNDTLADHQMCDNGKIINGSQVDVKNPKSDEQTHLELQVSEPAEAEEHLEEEWAVTKTTPKRAEEEQVLSSNGDHTIPVNQMLDSVQTIKAIELACTNYQVGEPSESERNIEELAASKEIVDPITPDVIVEVFPLPSGTKTTNSLSGSLEEARDLNNPPEKREIEKEELELGNGIFLSDEMSSTVNSNFGVNKSVADLSDFVEEVVEKDLVEQSLETSSPSSRGEAIKQDSYKVKVLEAKLSCNDVGTTDLSEKDPEAIGAKAVSAPNGVPTNIGNETCSGSSRVEVIIHETIANQRKVDVQYSGSSHKGSNATLDRINLESWEVTSRKSSRPESNPLVATLKAFIAAFLKFWSE